MRNVFFALIFLISTNLNAQILNPFYQSVVNEVQYDTVLTHLQHFEALGTKSLSSQALRNTATWLCSEFSNLGYSSVVRDTFTYNANTLYNIVVTKTGTVNPNKYLILCGHYDTSNGPGANDNGSGVSIILEIARLIQSIPTERSVKFIIFSAEEAGLVGSDHYVSHTVVSENMDILLVLNIDEVGGIGGQANNTVTCEYDNSSPSSNNATSHLYTDTLSNLTALYSDLLTQQANAYGSDYMSFEDNGEIITGYFESNESSYVHSSADLLSHLDTSYVVDLARAATGATLYFAKAYSTMVGLQENSTSKFQLYPNPVFDQLHITSTTSDVSYFRLYDGHGRMLLQTAFCTSVDIPFTDFPPALYYYTLDCASEASHLSGKLLKQ